jgi:hypothetical protein
MGMLERYWLALVESFVEECNYVAQGGKLNFLGPASVGRVGLVEQLAEGDELLGVISGIKATDFHNPILMYRSVHQATAENTAQAHTVRRAS